MAEELNVASSNSAHHEITLPSNDYKTTAAPLPMKTALCTSMRKLYIYIIYLFIMCVIIFTICDSSSASSFSVEKSLNGSGIRRPALETTTAWFRVHPAGFALSSGAHHAARADPELPYQLAPLGASRGPRRTHPGGAVLAPEVAAQVVVVVSREPVGKWFRGSVDSRWKRTTGGKDNDRQEQGHLLEHLRGHAGSLLTDADSLDRTQSFETGSPLRVKCQQIAAPFIYTLGAATSSDGKDNHRASLAANRIGSSKDSSWQTAPVARRQTGHEE